MFNGLNFSIMYPSQDGSCNKLMCPWGKETNARARTGIRQGEVKIVRKWERYDSSSGPKSYIIGGGIPMVTHDGLHFEQMVCILKNSPFKGDRQVRPTLQFGDQFLGIGYLSANPDTNSKLFNIGRHRCRDSFHSLSRAGGFSYGCLKVCRLLGGNGVHFIYGLFQSAGLQPKDYSLYNTHKNDSTGKPNHPPIGRRLIEVLCLIIGGFFLGLRGWENLDDNRRLLRAVFIGSGYFLSACGWLLWLITFYRWSWGWWL